MKTKSYKNIFSITFGIEICKKDFMDDLYSLVKEYWPWKIITLQ